MAFYSCLIDPLFTILKWIISPKLLKNIVIFFKTLPRDFRALIGAVAISVQSYYYRVTNHTLLKSFAKVVKKFPQKTCFYFQDEVWSFKDVDEYSNKIANAFHAAGYKKGDSIALMMTNRPEYICIWLGLAKIGVVTALINTNLRSRPLIHSIEIAKCKGVIFSADLYEAVADIKTSLGPDVRTYQLDGTISNNSIVKLNDLLLPYSEKSSPPCSVKHNDHLVYIYTSGTTGLPKAAIIPHSRLLDMGVLIYYILRIDSDDTLYDPLPLYHTAGGLLGIGCSLFLGSTLVLRTKFSASNYISDCIKYKCTVGQYIGEICRYMLTVPSKPEDKNHYLKMFVGNGLRPAIWATFVDRFGVKKVMEVYGSTEGNLQMVNTDGKIGAVGFIPRFMPFSKYIGAIIKYDMEHDRILRNKDGFCIPCDVDEPGMFVGLIPGRYSVKQVHGYLDKKESEKKIIRNVFSNGDKAFVSGDLLMMDEMGYLYFRDRTGDTFRWKGENVSTAEVESVISNIVGLKDCIVYGVEISQQEGRAGMAAIVDPKCELNFDLFTQRLDTSLPKYAHPLFVRLLPEAELTGTFKLKKFNFQHQGFNPNIVKDPIYFKKGKTYCPLTKELYNDIVSGAIHL